MLQLITFFMMLIHFGTKLEGATKAVRLPVAPAALPGGDLAIDRLVVVLDARGRLVVEGGVVEREGGAAWWAGQAKLRRAGQETLGGPGGGAPHGRHPPRRPGRLVRVHPPDALARRRSGGSPTSPWSCCGSDAR